MTNASGNMVTANRMSFDPWGKRRDHHWESNNPTGGAPDHYPTTRGFTGHEHLDQVNLIHMNGRVYDPVIGRFLSADLYVQAPFNSQSFNRYSYVMNNPLGLIDPSGYCGTTVSQSGGSTTTNGQTNFTYSSCGGGSDMGMTPQGMNAYYYMQSLAFFSNGGPSGVYSMGNLNIDFANPGASLAQEVQQVGNGLVPVTLNGVGDTYLDPEMARRVGIFEEEASERGVELHFNSAFRTQERQNDLQNDPAALMPAGLSLHSAGLAVDVNYRSLPGDDMRTAVREAATEAGLSWGGNFGDPPHFYYNPGGNRFLLVNQGQVNYNRLTGN